MKQRNLSFSFENISKYRAEIYGFGILWIALYHTRAHYQDWCFWFLDYGSIGCEVFTFISGISLYHAMQKKPTLVHYLNRRLLRLYLPVILICYWEWLYLLFTRSLSVKRVISFMTLLRFWLEGTQQAWFLSFLLLAYFLYPFLYSFIHEGRGNYIVRTVVLVLVCVGLTVLLMQIQPGYYDMVEIAITRLPVFIIGTAFGRVVYEKKTIGRRSVWLYLALVLVFIGSFILLNQGILKGIYRRYFNMVPGITIVLLLSQLFSLGKGKLVNRCFAFLGAMTLELYLIHLLGRRLLPRTSFYIETNHLHYTIMLAVSIVLSYFVSKLNKYLSDRIFRHLS